MRFNKLENDFKGGCYGELCQSESETADRIAVELHIGTIFSERERYICH